MRTLKAQKMCTGEVMVGQAESKIKCINNNPFREYRVIFLSLDYAPGCSLSLSLFLNQEKKKENVDLLSSTPFFNHSLSSIDPFRPVHAPGCSSSEPSLVSFLSSLSVSLLLPEQRTEKEMCRQIKNHIPVFCKNNKRSEKKEHKTCSRTKKESIRHSQI